MNAALLFIIFTIGLAGVLLLIVFLAVKFGKPEPSEFNNYITSFNAKAKILFKNYD
jgi:cytochrome c biogenesis protein CcdA